MASSGYTGLVDKKVPLFDVKEFGKWLEQIKAECYLRPYAGKVLSTVTKDPATEFKLLYPYEYAKIAADKKPASEEAIFNDPVKELGAFLQGVLSVQDVAARDAIDAVPGENGEPGTPAIAAVEEVQAIPNELKVQIKLIFLKVME